jgi:hypothetical protein
MNRASDQKFWRIVACLTATQTGSVSVSVSLGIPVLKDVSAPTDLQRRRVCGCCGVNRDRYLRIAANKMSQKTAQETSISAVLPEISIYLYIYIYNASERSSLVSHKLQQTLV